jgi:hypothetical protein
MSLTVREEGLGHRTGDGEEAATSKNQQQKLPEPHVDSTHSSLISSLAPDADSISTPCGPICAAAFLSSACLIGTPPTTEMTSCKSTAVKSAASVTPWVNEGADDEDVTTWQVTSPCSNRTRAFTPLPSSDSLETVIPAAATAASFRSTPTTCERPGKSEASWFVMRPDECVLAQISFFATVTIFAWEQCSCGVTPARVSLR